MQVQTMSMDPRIAAIHYKDYRKKVREHREKRLAEATKLIQEGGKTFRAGRTQRSLIEKEDEQLMQSYREMARGQRILNVNSVIGAAGLSKDKLLPLIAIAGADWEYCFLRTENSTVSFVKDSWPRWNYTTGRYTSPAVSIPRSNLPSELWNSHWRSQNNKVSVDRCKALVPAIPAHLRPAGDLSKYHILWEANWEVTAPVDPLLLRHVAGPIYSVLAQWDLTPLEQSILEGRVG